MLIRKLLLLVITSIFVVLFNFISIINHIEATNQPKSASFLYNTNIANSSTLPFTGNRNIINNKRFQNNYKSNVISNLSENSSQVQGQIENNNNNHNFRNYIIKTTSNETKNSFRKLNMFSKEANVSDKMLLSLEDNIYNDSEQKENYENLTESRRIHSLNNAVRSKIFTHVTESSLNNETSNCLTCDVQAEHIKIPMLTLREMRLEFIKQQILHKLGMDEPPSTTSVEYIPLSIQQALHPLRHVPSENDLAVDDSSFGKVEQIVVFPEQVHAHCANSSGAICLTFAVPKDIHVERVSKAELWIHLPESKKWNQMPVVDLTESTSNVFISKMILESRRSKEETYGVVNVTEIVEKWSLSSNFSILERPESKTIIFTCESCGLQSVLINSARSSRRPFLIINMADTIYKRRPRRNVNCSAKSVRCCRERLEVDFNEFDWNFVISPKKYEAFFCKGSCFDLIGSVPNPNKHHITLRQKIVQKRGLTNETTSLLPCCAATKMSSISLLYMQNNHTIKRETLPNMVIESCGCV